MPLHKLEALTAGNFYQAIRIRRALLSSIKDTGDNCGRSLSDSVLPMYHYDYSQVQGRCAENVIGYMPIPVGIAGPLRIDGTSYLVPLATTEGALIASTSRGAKALNAGQGIHTELLDDAMTRAPVLHFPSLQHAAATTKFLASTQGRQILKTAFDSTSAYARLLDVTPKVVGSAVYLRFRATTGDAMGMNMVGKGVSHALATLPRYSTLCPSLAHMQLSSLSSNTCTDKKPAATNWINGRGKSICAEATVPAKAVETVLKASVDALVALNTSKNLVGSALAGMGAGGYNAQAANIVAALSIATGQDAAQVVTSSNCLTHMEKTPDADLKISVTMPSLEVGTIGGGTSLSSQSSMLKLLGCRDADAAYGANASRLGRVIAGAVLAGELSLMSALVSQDLIGSHMQLNRK
ncbi:hydroxymethylglutaryl-CoA reductase [Aureobasidium namibiae CBS 147.97]|uniref:hydroxymethylglutaryl-CoA reductase (NADPH) n=1 Tax=Aureobasidium namibiae CBS 147.97 TaxID=1043004 RepID=A0A074WUC6_9PEZI|nr:hydroxymethylglutaryl-CoA reductase [Aureobasidium namibiae CBS 147.97]KEQ75114.1 hydroxymethylglutaryl-CoA reductase [Aureobasidium namibiae CBS 147.97]